MVPQHQWPWHAHELATVRGEDAGGGGRGVAKWEPQQVGRGRQFRPLSLTLPPSPRPQEWNPDLPHTAAKKEKQPKKAEGATLSNASGAAESTSQAGDRGR